MSDSPNNTPEPIIKNILQEIDDIKKNLAKVEEDFDNINEIVEKALDSLVDKYQDQLRQFGDLEDVRRRIKNSHRQRFIWEKESSLKKAKHELEKSENDLIIFP
jgi:hypothetical protein